MILIQDLGVGLELDAEHQFLPLLGGLDALWRELGLGRHEADGGGEHVLRERDRGSCAPRSPSVSLPACIRRQIDRHVDVVQIEDRQNALSCGNHLAGAGEPVLHASASRRDEHQIDQNRLKPFDISLGCLDRGLGLIALGIRCNIFRLGCFEFVAALIDDLLRIPLSQQSLSALIIGPREFQIALALGDECDRFRQCLFRFQHLAWARAAGLRFPATRSWRPTCPAVTSSPSSTVSVASRPGYFAATPPRSLRAGRWFSRSPRACRGRAGD